VNFRKNPFSPEDAAFTLVCGGVERWEVERGLRVRAIGLAFRKEFEVSMQLSVDVLLVESQQGEGMRVIEERPGLEERFGDLRIHAFDAVLVFFSASMAKVFSSMASARLRRQKPGATDWTRVSSRAPWGFVSSIRASRRAL